MKITEINVVPKNFELDHTFKFASCTLQYLPYALVQIKTDENITGYGECPVYWDPSGETQESVVGAVKFIAPALVGLSPFQLEKILQIFDKNIFGAYSAECGIDMALYDILGKKLDVPIYELLGGNNNKVVVNAVISLGDVKNSMAKVSKANEEGINIYKMKVGINLENELEIIRAARDLLGPDKQIFVDANQGWKTAKDAIRAINKLDRYELAWVEQPTPALDWEGMRTVTRRVDVPIMADESLYSPEDAFRMAAGGYADMFNIKLAKSGGLYRGKQIADIGRVSGIPVALGSMIESQLGSLAGYHFSKAIETSTNAMRATTLISNNYDFGIYVDKGELKVKEELPGLGYLDEEVLEKEFDV